MVLIIIVTGVYKPAYNWGGPTLYSQVLMNVLEGAYLAA